MSTKTLHYAKLGDENDIPRYVCETMNTLQKTVEKLLSETSKSINIVYLLSVNSEVYVSSDRFLIISLLKELYSNTRASDVFLQEYESYEEAYEFALSMKEVTPNCYKEEPQFIQIKDRISLKFQN